MKIKSTFLILFISIWVNQFYGQFTPQKPDLRNCGSAPNYYLDHFSCNSNNYTLDDVFLSISNSSGVPITTPCAPPNIQNVFLWLNYTSNSNSSIHQTRIFADILVKDQNGNLIQTLQINSYLGEVVPGIGQRLLSLPIPYNVTGFPWTCGYELSLTRLLVVWEPNGNSNDPEFSSYNCNTYNKSQCELPTSMIVSAPMAVQFDYTQCTIGNTTTVNFDDDTNGGDSPYTYLWNFGDSTTSTLQNPTHTYPYPGGPYTVTLQVTDSGSPAQVSTSVQTINLINPINITGNVTSSPCSSGNVGAIDVSVSGGTPFLTPTLHYNYLWSNGATSQDLTGLANGTYIVTVTDSVGCTAQQTFIITGGDVTPPVVTAPANQIFQGCNTGAIATNGHFPFSSSIAPLTQTQFTTAGGTISDASAISSVTYIDTVLGTCPRVVSRLFTIKDACNNTTQVTQTFTIQDTTPPNITTPASDLTVECDGAGNASELAAWLASSGGASASDICSGPVNWSHNYSALSDDCGATGSATVTFTATDLCGNTSTSSATFTIEDTTNPEIDTEANNLTVECDGAGNASELAAWLASSGGASASDVCSGPVNWSHNYSALSDDCGATGSATVTFTATDLCGNTSTSTATFTIEDTTNPEIDTEANNLTVECDGAGNASELAAWLTSNGGASASDVCSGPVNWSHNYSALSDDCGATGSATVTFTATDLCGNTSTSSATFTIEDTTNPEIDTEANNLTVECDGAGNASELAAWLASSGGASASDVCSGPVNWSHNYSALSDDCGATGSATVTFTATDLCGNTSTSTATFTIEDTTNPEIDTEANNLTVECDGAGNASELAAWLTSNGGASASDVCSGPVNWSHNYSALSDDCGATGSATVTFTATDLCGNTSTSSATFTIEDTTNPEIDTEANNLTVECDGAGNASELAAWLASSGGASASDVCSGPVNWSHNYSALSDDCGATGSATVTFTATDLCGNTSISSATFTIEDTTNPEIDTEANNLTVECDGAGNASELAAWLASSGGASASDVCSGPVNWSHNYLALSDDCGATGSATVTFTATDLCGNTSTSSATFTIEDTTNPEIDIEANNLTVECDGAGNASELVAWLASSGGASASDVCSGPVNWSHNYSALSDDCGATGSATVTFTATDLCGNTSTSSATFTIEDTTNPEIDIEANNLTVECDGAGNASELVAWLASSGGASASDVCSGPVNWSHNYSALSDDCGATGSATVTFTATDLCGNTSTSSATFTIEDTTDPEIDTEANNLTVECDGAGNASELAAWLASSGGASASDVCSGPVNWSHNYSALSDDCGATGSATVTFTATDLCGNTSTSSATFTIEDTTNPEIDTEANNLTVECDGAGNASELAAWLASSGGASASDVCSGPVNWSHNYSALSDDCGATGSATVTFTATDLCGNTSTSTATFTIEDTTNPEIDIEANNLTVECDGAGNASELAAWLASSGGASASDVCSGPVNWSHNYSALSDDCGATGSATVTFTATDLCGNTSTSSATFTIEDTTNPEIDTEANNLTVECDGAGNASELAAWLASSGGASASDVCSGPVNWSHNFGEGSFSDLCGMTGSATITFTATDACGNASSSTGTFTIQDTTDPVFTSELPQNISVSCDAIPLPQELTGSDSCSGQITVTTNDDIVENEGTCTGQFTILRTWTITDSCGNDLSYTQTISVYDNTAPTLVTDLDTELFDIDCSVIPEIPQLEFTDNCSGVDPNIVYTETTTIISIYQYVIIREWTVNDNCGNEASFSQTINVSVDKPFDAIPYSICTNETVDLFTIEGLPDDLEQLEGTWVEVNSSGALNGSVFNPSNLILGNYYTVRYIVDLEDNSCPMIYEVYIHVDCEVLAECDIVVFNAVSPNGDGLNEVFTISGITCYPNNTVEIYNRWGVNVYKARGYNNSSVSFDGQSQNKLTVGDDKLPGDTYFYILKYIDNENNSIEKTGYLYVKY